MKYNLHLNNWFNWIYWIVSIITPVFCVTWSFRNHSNVMSWVCSLSFSLSRPGPACLFFPTCSSLQLALALLLCHTCSHFCLITFSLLLASVSPCSLLDYFVCTWTQRLCVMLSTWTFTFMNKFQLCYLSSRQESSFTEEFIYFVFVPVLCHCSTDCLCLFFNKSHYKNLPLHLDPLFHLTL